MIKKLTTRQYQTKAFTMVELSIVISIIALIMVAVMSGRAMVERYQLRNIIFEYQYYQSAVNSFKGQFGQLPGDFNKASTVWPSCLNVNGTIANCNGNNDGWIFYGGVQYADETLRAWQHLGLASMIEGSYTGFYAIVAQNDIGSNVAASKWPAVGWYFDQRFPNNVTPNYVNGIIIGGFSAGTYNKAPFLTPSQAAIIDNKIDDGKPITGTVRGTSSDVVGAWQGGGGVGTQCGVNASNTYNNGVTYVNTKICGLGFAL